MTDQVEAAARLAYINGPYREAFIRGWEAAIRADVVPTGDAGLDHAPDCDVFRIAESWEPYGEPRHCDCGFALWDAKRRGVYNWTPPTGDAGLDVERLARAFVTVIDRRPTKVEVTYFYGDAIPVEHQRDAFLRSVADEYARLSSSDTGGRG